MDEAVHYYRHDQRRCACGGPWMYKRHTGDAEKVTCKLCIRTLGEMVAERLSCDHSRRAIYNGQLRCITCNALTMEMDR